MIKQTIKPKKFNPNGDSDKSKNLDFLSGLEAEEKQSTTEIDKALKNLNAAKEEHKRQEAEKERARQKRLADERRERESRRSCGC